MLQYMNDALKPLSELDTQIHEALKKTVDELDKKLKNGGSIDTVYLVEFYEGDDGGCRSHEVYTSREDAKKRFFEIMNYWFQSDIKDAGIREDMDWSKVTGIDCGCFRFTTDSYSWYYQRRIAEKKYGDDPMYPRNTWSACNPDYYNEVTMKQVKLNTKNIKSEDEKKD